MALSADRDTKAREGQLHTGPAAAAIKIFAGALVALDALGNLTPGAASPTLIGAGRAEEQVDNSTGSAGDQTVTYRKGVFKYGNSADADLITRADIERNCYIVDDGTVAKTSASGTRSVAGVIKDVDSDGVWVAFGADAAVPAQAVSLPTLSNKASDAAVVSFVAPFAGSIKKAYTGLLVALATGDATLTLKINGVAVTGGVITVTQAGSAAGDVDSATPSAANTFAAGDIISVTAGGASTATSTSTVSLLLQPAA